MVALCPHRHPEERRTWSPPAQFTWVPAPGSGIAPRLSARFSYASASGQGRAIGRATLVIETGSISGGRSAGAIG